LAGWVLAIELVLRPLTPAAQQQPFIERVEVARVLIDARVFDDRGRPMSDLQPSDFLVKIDGKPVRVESAEWVGSGAGAPDAEGAPEGAPRRRTEIQAPLSRLVVFLVQKDLEPSRITGLMQMSRLADTLLRSLTRKDRVAVLSFDSRLRIWTDFTNDLGRVRAILADEVIRMHPRPAAASGDVSLMTTLDLAAASRVYGIEDAMRNIAQSLERLPGAKSLVLLGYGFGRFDARSGSVILMDGYDEASAALQRARVSVFTLNVTQAHYNSLQAGLLTVSSDTGGLYASTFEFPTLAAQRVSHALAGHYVLFVEKPDLEAGEHRIEVRLADRDGAVMARSSYVERR
jgi:VWFA-related protein